MSASCFIDLYVTMEYFYPVWLLHKGEKGGNVDRMTEEDNSVFLGLPSSSHANIQTKKIECNYSITRIPLMKSLTSQEIIIND